MAKQAERRATTQTAIMDSALAVLEAEGLAGFTTTEIVRRCGKSQGALFRYFPTKPILLAATVEHLFASLRDTYEVTLIEAMHDKHSPPAVRDAITLLWDVMSDSRLLAAFELYGAARTDAELADALRPVVEAHVAHIQSLGRRALSALGVQLDEEAAVLAERWIELVVLAMQGLAIQEIAQPDVERRTRLLELFVEQAQQLMGVVAGIGVTS